MKSYKFRIYPIKKQEERLEKALDQSCFLYNQLLDIHQQIYLGEERTLSQFDMNYIVKDFDMKQLHSNVKQNISKRLSDSFKHFFRRCKNGETPGFPKFKKRIFYSSFTFPDYRQKIKDNKVPISRIGKVHISQHRELEGKVKTLTIKKENSEWYAIFSCEEVPIEKQKTNFKSEVDGVDIGIKKFLVCSNGQEVENPTFLKKSEKKLKRLNRKHSKKKKGSKNKTKSRIKLANQYMKVRRQREDFQKKLARNLAMEIKYIGVEDLNIKGMVKNHCLAKSISDASWGQFISYLKYYKTIFDGEIIEIGRFEPTSKLCSSCNHKQNMPLEKRTFKCESCGIEIDRDLNASLNIKKLTIKKLIDEKIKFNTPGYGEFQACGDSIRPTFEFTQEKAIVDEAGSYREIVC